MRPAGCGSGRPVRLGDAGAIGRIARTALLVAAAVAALTVWDARAEDVPYHTKIPHRDGSGRATIVDVDPGVPGAKDFVRENDRPPPAPGELSLPPPTPHPTPTPRSAPSPGR